MACKIDYIEKQPFSDSEKERLSSIHRSIFDRAKSSKAFRTFNDKLFTLKNEYNKATEFVYNTNNEYAAPITRIDTSAPGQHYLNVNVLPLAEEVQGQLFQIENIPTSVASPETLKRVKEALVKMKVSVQDLAEYAKKNKLDTTSINGLTDLSRGIISIADGKESVALTEEMVHIATQIIEQTNPKMVTEMISKIDRFNIYKQVYQEYKDTYLTPQGKPDIRKIKKEAVDKLIAELIVNNGQEFEQYPELREETNRSLIRKWWQDILDFIRGLYRESNIYIFDEAAKQIIEGEIENPYKIKEGVDFVFHENPELENIGSKSQYSQYLDTIFPNSKVKDIVYHGSKAPNIKEFKKSEYGHEGISFTYSKNRAEGYAKDASWNTVKKDGTPWYGKVYSVLINAKEIGKDYEDLENLQEELIVFEPEQIHILGSDKDIDGFKEFIKSISSGVFYQLSDKQKEIQEKIKLTSDRVEKVQSEEKVDPILLDSEEASNFYRIKDDQGNWTKITRRVTDRVKNWYKERFPGKVFSKSEQEFNELKRQYGVQGHQDLEEIHSRFYNTDGTKRENPLEKPVKFNLPSQDMYNKLEKWYTGYIKTLPKDTLVFSEVIIYDEKQKEAGTIDFLAVEPSGKTTILDWKFMNVSANQEDVAWYKQGAYNLQIGRYKDILRDNYGVKEFGQLRAIPIIMQFDFKKGQTPKIKGIAIGSVDTSKIENLTLLPVAEESESTGYEALDNIIRRLNAHLKQVAKEKVTSEEEKTFKFERMSIISKAVRQAQITQNVTSLIDVIEVMRKEGDRILGEYTTSYKDRPASSEDNTDSELSDFSEEMRDYIKLSDVFTDIGDDLGKLIFDEGVNEKGVSEEELDRRKELFNKLNEESRLIRISRKEIQKAANAFADKHIGERNLVVSLLKPEKVVKGLGSMFRGVSELPLRSLEILYKLTRNAQGKASEDALKSINSLMEIREKLSKRGNLRDLVKQVYQKDDKGKFVNRLIYKYNHDFFEQLDQKAKEGGDIKWIKDNINLEDYKKEAKEVIERQIGYINKVRYKGTQHEEQAFKEQEIEKVKQQFDISRPDFNGWNNYVLKRHPQDKWFSEDYKNIQKDAELLELYNFIVSFNDKAKDIGYINGAISKTFLPFVRKSMAEELAWDHTISPIAQFQDSIQLRAENVGYGNINQSTGELENSIPKYYTYDFTKKDGVNDYSEVSEDLFKNLILYIQQVEKYKYLSEVEGQLKLVKTIEEFKGHINTGKSGNVVRDKSGNIEELPGNAENTKMFDDFLRVLLYDQKYVLSDTDTPLQVGKVVNFVKKSVNKVAGKEIWKEDENPTPTSLIKTIDAANRGFQLKTLGFEFISGAVNLFGGNIQIATQAGNYFKAREFAKNEVKLTTQKFDNKNDREMFIQLVNVFMPLKDDPAYEVYKKAGMSVLTQNNLSDILMVFMREGEQLVEKSIFLSLLENTMVIDGKIVNIREHVKSKYKNRYDNASSYNQIKGQIESEIDTLKKEKSIAAIKKLEDGKLVIPGLDLNNREELQRLTNLTRRLSRNAVGGISDGDVNRMSMSVWTKSMMIFKNWIPKLADTRFSEFRKVADDFSVRIDENGIPTGQKYDIGRLRLLAYVLSDGIFTGVKNLNNIINLNQSGLDRLDQMFNKFRDKYELETGETLNITREDFIDLIRNNLRNQLKELAILGSLLGVMLSIGLIEPDDDNDKATKNLHRYAQRVVDKFVSELSFFYNPAELESILSGGIFPAIGLVKDFERFTHHFWLETTGLDLDPSTSYEDVREKAQPIKNMMRMMPVSKSLITYLSIFNSQFAKEFDVTISKESGR